MQIKYKCITRAVEGRCPHAVMVGGSTTHAVTTKQLVMKACAAHAPFAFRLGWCCVICVVYLRCLLMFHHVFVCVAAGRELGGEEVARGGAGWKVDGWSGGGGWVDLGCAEEGGVWGRKRKRVGGCKTNQTLFS